MNRFVTALFSLFFGITLIRPGGLRRRYQERDPDAIGNRDVGKGVNFYSIEKEIALGKQLAQQVERQAKIIDDPIIAEYVNRVGQNLVRATCTGGLCAVVLANGC